MMIIAVLIVLLLVFMLFVYNKFVKLSNKVNDAFSTMDVYFKKRWDLIPNLVETVKGYAIYERSTLEETIKLRNSNYDDLNNNNKIETNEKLDQSIIKLIALKEAYPELKANDSFRNLSNELTNIENELTSARKYYNGTIRDYNNLVQMFPSNIIALIFGFKTKKMFSVNANERENIKLDL